MSEQEVPALIILRVKSIPEIIDRKISKSQENCQNCGCPFGKKGASQAQKHVCRFCYQAVCSACSPLTAIHPENNESERICLKCYTLHLRIYIEDENVPITEKLIQEEIERFRREALENYSKELHHIKEEQERRQNNLQDQIIKLNNEVQAKDQKVNTISFNDSAQNESIEKFKKEMHEIDLENQRLQKEIESIKENQRKYVTPAEKGGCLKSCVVF